MYLVYVLKWFDDIDLWGNLKICIIMIFYLNFLGNVVIDSLVCVVVFICI